MYAIGDVRDRNFLRRKVFPYFLPHVTGYFSVKFRNPVIVRGKPEGEHRQAEQFVPVLRIFPPEGEEIAPGNLDFLDEGFQIALHELDREAFVARGYGRMGRKYVRVPEKPEGLVPR